MTHQPLPFGRLEREKHIQMIFRAFKNRCGPTCQCHIPSQGLTTSHQTPPPDWESEEQSRMVNRPQVEKAWPAAGSYLMSALQTADKIDIIARSELQGEEALLWGTKDIYRVCIRRKICHSRSTVCSQEDLQHHSRKQQDTVICGGGRYWPFIEHSFHLGQYSERIPPDLSLLSESSCVCLQCCGPARAYSLQGFDCQGCQVFYFERPFRVDACCLGCCLMEMRIYTPQKHLVGTVYQR